MALLQKTQQVHGAILQNLQGQPETRALDPATWHLEPPRSGTTDPLVVWFPRPLDYALLSRALFVSLGGGRVAGDIRIADAETRWLFLPRLPWRPGEYRLNVASILEDPAGNRIGRPFELEIAPRGRVGGDPTPAVLPFQIPST